MYAFGIGVLINCINVCMYVCMYVGLLTWEGTPCVRYMTKHSAFLSSLVPHKFARDMVAEIKQSYFSQQVMIGVHCTTTNAYFLCMRIGMYERMYACILH
jgi:hypothetical protein